MYSKTWKMRTLEKADTCEMWTLEVGTDRFYSLNTLNNADTCHLRTRTAFFGTEDALNLRITDSSVVIQLFAPAD